MSSNAAATNGLIEALSLHVRELSVKIGERSVLRGDGLDRAKTYVRGAFEAAGLTVTEQAYEYDGRRVANLIADPPGAATDATPYIIGAHYDSVIGTPGADDNASAVAVMLELARRATAKPPGVPLRFVAFTLEEPPTHATRHQGSRVRRTGQRAGQQHLFGQRQGQLQPARRVRDRQGECQVQAQAAVSFVRQHAAQTGLRQHGGHLMRIVARQRISDGRVGGLRKLFGPQFFAAHVKSLGSCMTRCAITSSCTSVVPA